MRFAVGVLAAFLAACSSRPQPVSPYVPPEAMHSGASTLAAATGLMAAAVGADLMDDDSRWARGRNRKAMKATGAGLVAGGVALMGLAVLEAIEVQKEREKFFKLNAAFWREYRGSPVPDRPFRDPVPPPPEVPFKFDPEDSPLSGRPEP
jgi:hypothetical protein